MHRRYPRFGPRSDANRLPEVTSVWCLVFDGCDIPGEVMEMRAIIGTQDGDARIIDGAGASDVFKRHAEQRIHHRGQQHAVADHKYAVICLRSLRD